MRMIEHQRYAPRSMVHFSRVLEMCRYNNQSLLRGCSCRTLPRRSIATCVYGLFPAEGKIQPTVLPVVGPGYNYVVKGWRRINDSHIIYMHTNNHGLPLTPWNVAYVL